MERLRTVGRYRGATRAAALAGLGALVASLGCMRADLKLLRTRLQTGSTAEETAETIKKIIDLRAPYGADVIRDYALNRPLVVWDGRHGVALVHDDRSGETFQATSWDYHVRPTVLHTAASGERPVVFERLEVAKAAPDALVFEARTKDGGMTHCLVFRFSRGECTGQSWSEGPCR